MMIILLTLLQLLMGMGLVNMFKIWLKPGMLIALWILSGLMIFSWVPFLLQLMYVPITATNICVALVTACLLLNVKYKKTIEQIRRLITESKFSVRLYEIPFLVVITFIVAMSVWRCFYYPPTPRDLTSGAEVIAEYTVKEKTIINSVFTVNLETTNNQFKPPFIISLQVIYKYAGFEFGQVWLCTVFIAVLLFLYHALSLHLHRLIAGLLMVIFIAIPEMYAYTFMALFDYSNAVFFFLAAFFLFEYFKNKDRNYLLLAALLMGFATYIRSETLILACMLALAIVWHHIREKKKWTAILTNGLWFLAPALLCYILSITIYINFYLPEKYNVEGLINKNLLDLHPLWERLIAMNKELIFSEDGIEMYAYIFFLFLLVLLCDLIYSIRLNRDARNWLFAVLVIYLGMPVLGYLLPLLDLDNSTKRGLFKIFPLMIMYMGTSPLLIKLSKRIRIWEEKPGTISL